MATTIVYLDSEDVKKLAAGEKVEISVTKFIRDSDKIWIRVNQAEQRKEK